MLGWQLMALCCGTFPPSNDFANYLSVFLQTAQEKLPPVTSKLDPSVSVEERAAAKLEGFDEPDSKSPSGKGERKADAHKRSASAMPSKTASPATKGAGHSKDDSDTDTKANDKEEPPTLGHYVAYCRKILPK
jgi:hypothetical protein